MLNLFRYVLAVLILLLVFLASALVAMRYAIRGREVTVPALVGQTPAEAERSSNNAGVVLFVESRFYSPLPQGRIVSQMPEPGARVRRGWRIMVAESLGPQRVAIPNVVGQSQHAAEINLTRRGLEIGSIATMHAPGVPPGTVLAQSPPPDDKEATSPRIDLLLTAADNSPAYVMPSFAGKPLSEAEAILNKSGFTVGKVSTVIYNAVPRISGIIIQQYPAAGKKVPLGSAINFDVSQ